MTVFLLILKQMEFHLVQNRKGRLSPQPYPFDLKENRNKVFSVCKLKSEYFPHIDPQINLNNIQE